MRAAGDYINNLPSEVALCITEPMKWLHIRRTPIQSTSEMRKKKSLAEDT